MGRRTIKLLKIILFCACSFATNNIAVSGFAINSNENNGNSESLYSNYGQQTNNVNGVRNHGFVVLVPVDQDTSADGKRNENEENLKSITHPPGHKTKRCKSLTSLRKARLGAPVNNDDSKLQSGNFVDKNQVAYFKNNNKEPTLFQYNDEARLGKEKKSLILKNVMADQYNNAESDKNEILFLESRDLGPSAKKKKFICYCVEDDCQNEHYKQEPTTSFYQADGNIMNPGQFENNDDSYSLMNPSNPRPSLKEGNRQNLYGKRIKNKKCIPFMVPCNLNDNPTKFILPLASESPSTLNPYYDPIQNNYGSVNEAYENGLYTSPYVRYPQRNFQQSLVGSTDGITHDYSYLNSQPESISSRLDECMKLYGRDYCLSLDHYKYDESPARMTNPALNNRHYLSSTELSSYDEQMPRTCHQNILGSAGANENSPSYHDIDNTHYQSPLFDLNNKYTGYDEHTISHHDPYLEDTMNTGVVDSSTEYIIRDAEINHSHTPYIDNHYSNQHQQQQQQPHQIQDGHEKVSPVLHRPVADEEQMGQDYYSMPTDIIVNNSNDYSDLSYSLEPPLGKSTIVQPGYHYHNTQPQSANMRVSSSSEIPPNDNNDEQLTEPEDFTSQQNSASQVFQGEEVSVNYDGNMPTSSESSLSPPDYDTLGHQYLNTLSSEEEPIDDYQVSSNSEQNSDESIVPTTENLNAYTSSDYSLGETNDGTFPPLESLQDTSSAAPMECSMPEMVSTTTDNDQDLAELKRLTGLSIQHTKLLRGIIYETLNNLAFDATPTVSSACRLNLLAATTPTIDSMLGNPQTIQELFHIPAVRNLTIDTIKTTISRTNDDSLKGLTDDVIAKSLSIIVVGDDDFTEESIELPELGSPIESNIGASIPETIYNIINSMISRPGIGLNGVRLPGIQNIIVKAIENIFAHTKNVVDNSSIRDALNTYINAQETNLKPTIPSAYVAPHHIVDTKPLPYIPVTEHYIQNGVWHEGPATVGYKGEFPEAKTPITPLGMTSNQRLDESSIEQSQIDADQAITTTYHSPEDIVLEYIKKHSADENPSTMHHLETEEPITQGYSISQEDYNNSDEQLKKSILTEEGGEGEGDVEGEEGEEEEEDEEDSQTAVRIPVLANIHEDLGDETPGESLASNVETIQNPTTYLGKIVTDVDSSSSNNRRIDDLEGSNLYYIGDGVKLPLTIKRLSDGSFALSLSDIICQNFVKNNCPCCLSKSGNISQERSNVRETMAAYNGEVRSSRHTFGNLHSRRIRSTTSNGQEIIDDNFDEFPITVMPVEKFAQKYNLTLNSNFKSDEQIVNSITRNDENINAPISNSDYSRSREKNEYIQDLLSIQDVVENDRAALVINALDGLLNSPLHHTSSSQQSLEQIETDNGFEYQIDNPIMQRMKYIKEKELGHGKYRYQNNFEHAARIRMEAAKNLLHWLRELLIKSKANDST